LSKNNPHSNWWGEKTCKKLTTKREARAKLGASISWRAWEAKDLKTFISGRPPRKTLHLDPFDLV
jgi:hypothetical protein